MPKQDKPQMVKVWLTAAAPKVIVPYVGVGQLSNGEEFTFTIQKIGDCILAPLELVTKWEESYPGAFSLDPPQTEPTPAPQAEQESLE